MRLEVYPSEQLAKELEAIRLIQAGVLDMTITGSTLNNWDGDCCLLLNCPIS